VHGRVSAEIAEKYLREQGYPADFVDRYARRLPNMAATLDFSQSRSKEKFCLGREKC